ncbi:uncharacterized protein LOC100002197 isoform 1 [Danio rerio]|uniref:Si:dkey-31c13.1 n=1 Tax=Danio rerio TaxID=7955 RepID=A0A0R4IB27_DANRE|nr:uncharacterized protein LOC100002197 isoform 1 [Danio rerio]|eukprot:XP_009289800.1 uncharacterized protein si:dkey-31c13.1 isoform X1 [Danio rerio]
MAAGYIQRFPSKRCFERNFKSYVHDTMTKFVVWTKDRSFGVEDPKLGSKCIVWELQYVPFDGIPFMLVGRMVYSCHRGADKHKHQKQKRQEQLLDDSSDHSNKEKRRRLRVSKKLDCPARIYVVHLIRFPDYKIPENIPKQRKASACQLRRAIASNPSAVKFDEQYVAYFPGVDEHKKHTVVGEATEIQETVDTTVQKPIETLVDDGNTPTQDDDTNRIKQKQQKCESLLREISELTSDLHDELFLDSLTVRLKDLLEDVRCHTSHDATLPVPYTPPCKKRKCLEPLNAIPENHPSTAVEDLAVMEKQ